MSPEAEIAGYYAAWFNHGDGGSSDDDWLSHDVLVCTPSGEAFSRDEYRGQVPASKTPELLELRLQPYSDFAVARGVLGQDPSPRRRFTSLWVRQAQGWRCVTHHETYESAR
jgi:hypothetical protein